MECRSSRSSASGQLPVDEGVGIEVEDGRNSRLLQDMAQQVRLGGAVELQDVVLEAEAGKVRDRQPLELDQLEAPRAWSRTRLRSGPPAARRSARPGGAAGTTRTRRGRTRGGSWKRRCRRPARRTDPSNASRPARPRSVEASGGGRGSAPASATGHLPGSADRSGGGRRPAEDQPLARVDDRHLPEPRLGLGQPLLERREPGRGPGPPAAARPRGSGCGRAGSPALPSVARVWRVSSAASSDAAPPRETPSWGPLPIIRWYRSRSYRTAFRLTTRESFAGGSDG